MKRCVGNSVRPINPHPGMKRMYEDSSSQSSVGSSRDGSALVPVVFGNDPFLSDASGNKDLVGVLPPTVLGINVKHSVPPSFSAGVDDDVVDQSLPLFNLLSGSSQKVIDLKSIGSGLDGPLADLGESDVLRADKSKQISFVITSGNVKSRASAGGGNTTSIAVLPGSGPATTLAFGISHLLAADATKPTVCNVGSLLGLQSYDNVFIDCTATTAQSCAMTTTQSAGTAQSLQGLGLKHVVTSINTTTSSTVDFRSLIRISAGGDVALSKQSKSGEGEVVPRRNSHRVSVRRSKAGTSRGGDMTTPPPKQSDSTIASTVDMPNWKVVSQGECKITLRRKQDSVDSADSASPSASTSGKRRRLSARALSSSGRNDAKTLVRSFSSSSVPCVVDVRGSGSASTTTAMLAPPPVAENTSLCYGCKGEIVVSQLSYCMAGHGCCGRCLQSQVKTLLAVGKKVTIVVLFLRISCCLIYTVLGEWGRERVGGEAFADSRSGK